MSAAKFVFGSFCNAHAVWNIAGDPQLGDGVADSVQRLADLCCTGLNW